ncbi:unnamed protein product, partial [Brenthis ino]
MKRNLSKRTRKVTILPLSKPKDVKNQRIVEPDFQLHKAASCPSFIKNTKCSKDLLPIRIRKTYSAMLLNKQNHFFKSKLLQYDLILLNAHKRLSSTYSTVSPPQNPAYSAIKNISATCACPASCNCLPPPCNTPAKCLQYMTGYYYYPYGTWFCGPYHVKTGPSGPCSGPVNPCGRSPPCSGGPCGPACVAPCGPCGPLSCCGVCSVDGKSQSKQAYQPNNAFVTHDPWHTFNTYNYMHHPYMQYNYNPYSYTPYDQYGQYNLDNPYFGPGYNVPISPTPGQNPVNVPYPQPAQSSTTKNSAIRWPATPQKSPIKENSPLLSNLKSDSMAKKLDPKPTYSSPPFPYDTKPTLNRTNPYTKPKINARTLLPSNSIGICYFSTKCMHKYKNNNIKIKSKKTVNKQPVLKAYISEKYKDKKRLKNDWTIFEGKCDTQTP